MSLRDPRLACCLAWLLVLAIGASGRVASAQTRRLPQVTGVVMDATGAVLPGSAVDLIRGGRVVQTSTTDGTGTFTFAQVAAGRYDVRTTHDGFQPRTTAVRVGPRAPAPLQITLSLAGVHQEITVTNDVQVATAAASNANAVTLDQNAIESLPVFDDDVVGSLSRFLDSGALGTGGVTILVNGMEVNGLNVGSAAIQQIAINQDPYSAIYSRPGRGRIEVITKPGSQEYHGDADLVFRDARLNARNAFADVRPPEQRRIGDAFLGGPVGHGGATSFMLSVKDDSEDRQAIVYALGPNGEIRGSAAQPLRHVLASIGVTHQHGRSTISVRPSYEQETDAGRGAGGTTLASAGTTYFHRESDLTYDQQTVFGSGVVNQFQILVGQELEPMTSVSSAPGLVVNGAFTGGGAQVDVRRTERHFQLAENLTAARGRHLLQFGFQVPDWSRRGFNDQSGFGGTYYFSNLDAYGAGQPYAFIQQTGNGHVVWLEKVLGLYLNDNWQWRPGTTLSFGVRYDWSNYFADHDTVAPRLSFAVKPRGSTSTVIRGGAGLFYDKVGPFPIIDVLEFRPGGLQRVVLTDPSYPDPFQGGTPAATTPPSITQLAPGIQVPWTLQYSIGVERQLAQGATLSIMYDGSEARLLRSRDINAPLPPLYAARPDPAHGAIRQIDSSARQHGSALEITFRGRLGKWFNGQAQYTLGRVLNNSGGLNWFPANDYNPSGEWARASFDQRHRMFLLGTIAPGRQFAVGVSLTLKSGLPYSETLGTDPFNNGRGNARPPGVPRNSLQGAGSADLDLHVSRNFRVGVGASARTVTIALDGFNVLNRVNYLSYVGTVSSPRFGLPVSASAPRQLQLSARVKF